VKTVSVPSELDHSALLLRHWLVFGKEVFFGKRLAVGFWRPTAGKCGIYAPLKNTVNS